MTTLSVQPPTISSSPDSASSPEPSTPTSQPYIFVRPRIRQQSPPPHFDESEFTTNDDDDDRPDPSEYGDDELDGQSAVSYGGTLAGGPGWRAGSVPMGEREGSVAASDYSYSSSIDRQWILKEVHGRTINNTSEVSSNLR